MTQAVGLAVGRAVEVAEKRNILTDGFLLIKESVGTRLREVNTEQEQS